MGGGTGWRIVLLNLEEHRSNKGRNELGLLAGERYQLAGNQCVDIDGRGDLLEQTIDYVDGCLRVSSSTVMIVEGVVANATR